MDVGGATLAAAAIRARLIGEYVIVSHPVRGRAYGCARPTRSRWMKLSRLDPHEAPTVGRDDRGGHHALLSRNATTLVGATAATMRQLGR
jgi:hypothetical protein